MRHRRPQKHVPVVFLCGFRRRQRGDCQRLVEIGDDVVDVLDADGQAHVAGRYAAGELVGRAQLRVRGAGRVDGQRTRIADVGHVVEELERIDESRACLAALLELEADETTVPALEIGARAALLLGVLMQARVDDACDLGMALQMSATFAALRQCSRILKGSVSSPWMNWKALAGLMHMPMSRNSTTRARMM